MTLLLEVCNCLSKPPRDNGKFYLLHVKSSNDVMMCYLPKRDRGIAPRPKCSNVLLSSMALPTSYQRPSKNTNVRTCQKIPTMSY